MTFEPVLMIWDIYDGPRTGLANLKTSPHYFKCLWDKNAGNYSETYELSPITTSFLQSATRQWQIYREWELKFHQGLVHIETHPDHRGINHEYDQLKDELSNQIKKLIPLPNTFTTEFRALPNQSHLPKGVLRNLEANWQELRI